MVEHSWKEEDKTACPVGHPPYIGWEHSSCPICNPEPGSDIDYNSPTQAESITAQFKDLKT